MSDISDRCWGRKRKLHKTWMCWRWFFLKIVPDCKWPINHNFHMEYVGWCFYQPPKLRSKFRSWVDGGWEFNVENCGWFSGQYWVFIVHHLVTRDGTNCQEGSHDTYWHHPCKPSIFKVPGFYFFCKKYMGHLWPSTLPFYRNNQVIVFVPPPKNVSGAGPCMRPWWMEWFLKNSWSFLVLFGTKIMKI